MSFRAVVRALRKAEKVACPVCARSVYALPAVGVRTTAGDIPRWQIGTHAPPAGKPTIVHTRKGWLRGEGAGLACTGSGAVVRVGFGSRSQAVKCLTCGFRSSRVERGGDAPWGLCPGFQCRTPLVRPRPRSVKAAGK